MMLKRYTEAGAEFSADRVYRYSLTRAWGPDERYVLFIGLNPSTATETKDDPTIRRCIGYCKYWGFDRYRMANIFAYRATDPLDMKSCAEPIGPKNDAHLVLLATRATVIICAWGVHGGHRDRHAQVMDLLKSRGLCSLGTTKAGYPRHPLYLPKRLQPQRYTGEIKR